MTRVLVMGGAGYIGSHAWKAPAAAGAEPVVFDNLSNGHAQAVQFGPLVTGDVRDSLALADCMRRHAIGAVLHFAGLIEVGRSMVEPSEFWDVNLNGVASVLASMRACGVRRLVFSSTAAVYGPAAKGQPNEEDVASPVNPYGDSKLAAERLIAAHVRAHGIEGVALRYFTPLEPTLPARSAKPINRKVISSRWRSTPPSASALRFGCLGSTSPLMTALAYVITSTFRTWRQPTSPP